MSTLLAVGTHIIVITEKGGRPAVIIRHAELSAAIAECSDSSRVMLGVNGIGIDWIPATADEQEIAAACAARLLVGSIWDRLDAYIQRIKGTQ